MYSTEHDEAWDDHVIHTALKVEDAQTLRAYPFLVDVTVTIGDVDLPAFVSDGKLYIQAPLPHIFQAFAESISDFIRDMEVRVSTAGGTPLSLDSNGSPVLGSRVAKPRMVRSSALRRHRAPKSGNAGTTL